MARLFSHRVSCLESHLRFRFRYPVTVQTTSPCSGPTGERSSKIRNIPRYFGQVQEIGDPFTNPLEGIPSRERVRTHRPTRRDFTLLVFLPSSFLEGQSCRSLRGYTGLLPLYTTLPVSLIADTLSPSSFRYSDTPAPSDGRSSGGPPGPSYSSSNGPSSIGFPTCMTLFSKHFHVSGPS